jgi:hypothetical protein
MAIRHKLRAWLCCTTLFALAALLIAACGGSSHASSVASSTAAPDAAGGVPASAASHSPGHPHRLSAGRDTVSTGKVIHRPIRGTGGSEINDDNPGRADSGTGTATGPNPCDLVSKAQAQAIIGAPVASQEAPLGPTCIYEARGGKEPITVAVETVAFAKIRPMIHHPTRTIFLGHTLYCGEYGRPTTFVPLAHGQVLNVSASCSLGVRFAEKALSQLGNRYAL